MVIDCCLRVLCTLDSAFYNEKGACHTRFIWLIAFQGTILNCTGMARPGGGQNYIQQPLGMLGGGLSPGHTLALAPGTNSRLRAEDAPQPKLGPCGLPAALQLRPLLYCCAGVAKVPQDTSTASGKGLPLEPAQRQVPVSGGPDTGPTSGMSHCHQQWGFSGWGERWVGQNWAGGEQQGDLLPAQHLYPGVQASPSPEVPPTAAQCP